MVIKYLCFIQSNSGLFTLFAPSNDAFDREKWYPGEDDFCSKMSFHIGRGLHKKDDLNDEQVIKSLLSKRTVRVNIYPFKDNVSLPKRCISGFFFVVSGIGRLWKKYFTSSIQKL